MQGYISIFKEKDNTQKIKLLFQKLKLKKNDFLIFKTSPIENSVITELIMKDIKKVVDEIKRKKDSNVIAILLSGDISYVPKLNKRDKNNLKKWLEK